MFDFFKNTTTTKITRTINGKEVSDSDNPDLWKKFDTTMKKFDETMVSFDETMEELGKATITTTSSEEIELYGISKDDALSKANSYSVNGFKMTSLKEDENLKVWTATMKKES